jgi:polyisoprenoid-binding protein YceI
MAVEQWNIDTAHSGVYFVVRHMVVSKVRGSFTRWSGVITSADAAPGSARVEARIEVASIDTREPQRDAHLKSADFFDVERYPEIAFRSTRVEPVDEHNLRLTGDLTIRDVTRSVTLAVEFLGRGKDPWGNERMGFSATTAVNRGDFGLKWNQMLESGGVLVGEKVEIEIEVEALKAQPGTAAQAG